MQLFMTPGLAGKVRVGGPLTIPATRTASRSIAVAAAAKPNYKLEQPARLWELGEIWYPGAQPAPYLDGSLPADRGFDPLRLGENPKLLPWLVEGELYNGRIAMTAAVGVLGAEALGKGAWYEAPFAVNWPLSYTTSIIILHAFWGTCEFFRWSNFNKKGETGFLFFAPFDPLGQANDYMRQSEVRNGRLAMLANLGFWSQHAVTHRSPLQNLQDHLADPGHNNISTSPVGKEVAAFAIALGIIPYYLETRRELSPEDKKEEPFRPFPFLSPDEY